MPLQSYEMKDSGVEWIGEIPHDWKPMTMKRIINHRAGGAWGEDPKGNETDYICMRIADFNFAIGRFKDLPTDSYTKRNYTENQISKLALKKNDVLIEKSGGGEKTPVGRAVLFDKSIKALYANFMDCLRVNPNDIHAPFFEYWWRSMYYKTTTTLYIKQTIGIQNLDLTDLLEKELIFYPSLSEQQSIANYLDEKCAAIDEIIAEAKTTVDEYKSWKASVIFEAVTKGLDKNADMKDSGVEWIGMMPKHWAVVPLKRFYDNSNGSAVRVGPFGSALSGSDITSEGVWVYNQRAVLDNNFESNNTFVSPEKAKELANFGVFPKDILITTRGSIGKIAIVPDNAPYGILHPCIIRFRIDEQKIDKHLLKYIFNDTDLIKEQILYYSNSTTIDVLYSYTLKELKLPLIPKNEQDEIIAYLDEKCAAIDGVIAEKEALIGELESYKKSLIFETVTGKRRVC